MIAKLIQPFTAIWRAMVDRQREHLADDPDVTRLREQQHEAQRSNQRLNAVERRYLRGRQP